MQVSSIDGRRAEMSHIRALSISSVNQIKSNQTKSRANKKKQIKGQPLLLLENIFLPLNSN